MQTQAEPTACIAAQYAVKSELLEVMVLLEVLSTLYLLGSMTLPRLLNHNPLGANSDEHHFE